MTGIISDFADMKVINITAGLASLGLEIQKKDASLDAFFLITMAVIIYFMQCGFAFLEAGAVRSKNTTNILIKNILDSFIGGLSYYIIGYALAFGVPGNPFCGTSSFALAYTSVSKLHLFFFHFVFAATAATIVSGAVAERCDFRAYLIYSFALTGLVYPIVTHWTWDPSGWLSVGITVTTASNETIKSSFMDFAGSSVVHVLGGTSAFVAAVLLGPRIGLRDKITNEVKKIQGHSVPLCSLGGFILIFGFFAFNGGSQASISKAGDGEIVALACVNTIISAAVSAFTVMIVIRIKGEYWSLLETLNGALAGMVAVCAGCNVYYQWSACICGFIAGLSEMLWSFFVSRLGIDDPLDAVAVHFGGGIWGIICVAFFHKERGILFKWNLQSGLDLLWQIIGTFSIIAWSALLSLIIFGFCKIFKILRVDAEVEQKGLDIKKHGEPAYPLAAYGHGWGEDLGIAEIGHIKDVPEVVTFTKVNDSNVHDDNAFDGEKFTTYAMYEK